MEELISIIIPVYNVELYISKCIESVLNQTYKSFEVIIVDDGSPDNSIKIAQKYADIDKRIRIITKENGGLSDARNVGINQAKGKYIYFLDSDDYIEDNLLEKVVNYAEQNNSDVIIFGYFVDYVDDKGLVKYTNNVFLDSIESEVKYEDSFTIDNNLLAMLGYAWNKFYKREYLINNNIKFEKGVSLIEDILFNELALTKSKNIFILKDQLYHYIHRDRSTLSTTFYKDSYKLQVKSIKARENILKHWNIKDEIIQNIISKQQTEAIRFCCSNMFYYKNNLTLIEKYKYIKFMLDDENTKTRIQQFMPISIEEKIMKIIIKRKVSIIIILIYYINSRKYL